MKDNLKNLLILTVIFLSGCNGWRLTGKEFPKEQNRVHAAEQKETALSLEKDKIALQNLQKTEIPLEAAPNLKLRGVGVKTLFMIKLFIAGLYLPTNVDSKDALSPEVPKDLSVKFYAKFSSKDFVDFTLKNIRPNITSAEYDSLKNEFKHMQEISPDINNGDNLALSYEPNSGTSFIYNGTVKGTIPGKLFSKAIFSTWIGPKPFDNLVKRQILGIKTTRS